MASALSKSLVKKARKTAKERKSWGSEREFGDDRNGRGGFTSQQEEHMLVKQWMKRK